MPPIDDHEQDADQQKDRVLLEDFVFDQSMRPSYSAGTGRKLGRGGDARLVRRIDRLVAADGAPDVVGHDQRADEEQQAAGRRGSRRGLHRLDRLDEGVLQEAELVVGAPHQTLQ